MQLAGARRVRLALLFALAGAAPALGAAREASADELTAADRVTARTMLDEGYVQLSKGNALAALKLFQGANVTMKVPTTKLAVARAQAAAGLLVEASDTLTELLRTPLAANAPPPFKHARADGEALLAQTLPRIPQVTFELGGGGARSAELRVDEELVPAAALVAPRRMTPGKHVAIAKSGELVARESFDLVEGDRRTVKLRIEEGAPAAAAPPSPADHGKTEDDGAPRALRWIGGGVAVVGLTVGAITGLSALHSKQKALASGQCQDDACPRSAGSDIDSAHELATISTIAVAIGIGGAALAVAALLWPSHDPSAHAAPVRIVPTGVAGTF